MLQDLQVSRDLQTPQQHPAKSTVTTRQLCRVSTWQRQEAGTAKFTFVTQRITKSVFYRVLLIFASVSHLWVTNLRSCQLKGGFPASFCSVTVAPSPLMLPSLSERRTRMQRTGLEPSHVPACLPPLHLFLHRISDFPYTQFSSKLLLHV